MIDAIKIAQTLVYEESIVRITRLQEPTRPAWWRWTLWLAAAMTIEKIRRIP